MEAEVLRIYKHYRGGTHYPHVDGCDCCGKDYCRMCGEHVPPKEDDVLQDEIEREI